jgi:hypothetical protein
MVEAIDQIQPALMVDDAGEGGAAPRRRVRQLIALLLDERDRREKFRQAIGFERTCVMDTFECIATAKLPPGFLSMPGPGLLKPILPAWRISCIAVARRFDALVAALHEPTYFVAKQRMPRVRLAKSSIGWVFDRISVFLEPDFSEAVRMHYHGLALRRLAATALAMRLFEIDCGRPPESLEELVPDYLTSVPLDPMDGEGRTIGYLRTEDLPRLYSVGSDGIDEGGRIDWTSGYPESPRHEEIVFFLTGRPRPLRIDLYSILLNLNEPLAAPASAPIAR